MNVARFEENRIIYSFSKLCLVVFALSELRIRLKRRDTYAYLCMWMHVLSVASPQVWIGHGISFNGTQPRVCAR